MNAKEKAKQLIEKFKPYVYCYLGSGMLTNTYDEDVANSFAKKCAKISIDEIIDVSFGDKYVIEYWNNVKNELEKL
jgi:hypothetical protein